MNFFASNRSSVSRFYLRRDFNCVDSGTRGLIVAFLPWMQIFSKIDDACVISRFAALIILYNIGIVAMKLIGCSLKSVEVCVANLSY